MNRPGKIIPNFSTEKAHRTQLYLAKKIVSEDRLPAKIKTIAGVDVSYDRSTGIGALAILDYESLELLESQVATCGVKMPYIPTLLAFRETPPAMAAIRKTKLKPDVFIVDAQGFAHPYRCGFASYLGLILGKPTIGAAKSRLIGEPYKIKEQTFLIDKDEIIGAAVFTKENGKPIYVSVGHMVSLEKAVEIAKHCSNSRIPEPTLQAHKIATKERIRLLNESK